MSLYVDRFENNQGKPLVMVVANDASAGGNATPYVVSGVDPDSKNREFDVWLRRDQLDLLIEAVTYQHRMVRYDKVNEGLVEVRIDQASRPSAEARPGAIGGKLGLFSVAGAGELPAADVALRTVVITDPGGGNNGPKAIELLAADADPGTVVITDPGGGNNGPKAIELAAADVDPGTVVITDPGGGNNGPKDIVLKALAVDPASILPPEAVAA